MIALVLALRGALAIGVLVSLVGGIPPIVRAGLAVVVGLWSAALVGAAEPGIPEAVDGAVWLIAAREVVIGATIGVVTALPLLAIATAGRLVDLSGGLRSATRGGGPYSALFSLLAAAVFVGIDGHVALVAAIAGSFHDVPVIAVAEPRALAMLARLVPIAVQLAIPWLITAAVVELAAGVAVRVAGRAASHGPIAAATPAALVMMTASLIGTLAVAIAALVR